MIEKKDKVGGGGKKGRPRDERMAGGKNECLSHDDDIISFIAKSRVCVCEHVLVRNDLSPNTI